MNCFYCKGVDTVEEQPTWFCACESPQPFVVENVPASVCRLCGDKSFSAETVAALEKIKNGEAQAGGYQVMQVFDFEQLDKAGLPGTAGSQDQTLLRHYITRYLDQNPVTFYGSMPSWGPGVVYPFSQLKWGNPATWNIAGIKLGNVYQRNNVAIGDYSEGIWNQDMGVVGIVRQHSSDSPSYI